MSNSGAFVVTGAGSGIGQSIAVQIAERGHQVFGLGRDQAKLMNTSRLIRSGTFVFKAVDLACAEKTSSAVQEIQGWLDQTSLPLLGLVNNAGVYDNASFSETPDSIWERQFNSNLLSAVRLTRLLYPCLKAAAPSSVLNISSTLGLRPIVGTSAYSALKAAMVNWSQTLALEWAPYQIRVNCICPGIVETPIHGTRVLSGSLQPIGRVGQPHDIAKAAWFLLSEDSAWTTGSVLTVDGGISL
jgi:NAD(P)-dependent dehydrogenase (short-subunit alcohol dehydrogenase family)